MKKLTKVKEVRDEFEKNYDDTMKKAFVMLAKDGSGGGIVGCIAGCNDVDFDDGFETINIPIFVVAEAHRRKGYGERIMNKFMEYAKQKKYIAATLYVERENPAQNLYSRLGFVDVDEKRSVGDHREMIKVF